ncbi:MAG: hypothetical protein ABSD49_06445 [Candidatus Bathyarchaeia archaeon]|jgi:hypothetical protein
MGKVSPLQIGIVDVAAVLFVVGGVASFVMSLLVIPLVSVTLPVTFTSVFLIVLAITLICSLGAIHCYTLATKRLLSEAGMRGMIFGALLLVFSLGLVGSFSPATTTTFLAEVSAFLVLVGGVICFVLRHTTLSSSPIMRQ